MADRRESVTLVLDDQFSTGMARAAAASGLLNRELSSMSKRLTTSDRNAGKLSSTLGGLTAESGKARSGLSDLAVGGIIRVGDSADRSGAQIDRLSGRLGLLAKAGAAFGPGIIPILTAAVPALAGLSTQLGFAAAGAGVAVLAFNGVGDALGALNAYQLDPSAANFEKLQESMRGLGPAAREFVGFLDEIGPRLQTIREAAQEGLLPGVQEGLDSLLDRLPEVRRIVSEIADASGDLIAGAGAELAGSQWDDFFAFLEAEARPALTTLGQTVGNLAGGIAELWMAMDPFSDDFTAGLLDASAAFEQWAEGLAQTQGFADFLAYVRETGPQVLDTVGSLANMLIDVGVAAAPLGGPILAGIEALAKAISAIAESDFGTPIFTAVAAMSALSLASKGFAGVMASAPIGRVKGLTSDLRTMGQVGVVAWGQSADEAKRYNDAAGRVRKTLGSMGRTAGLVGGLTIATTGLGDSLGITNTASMALIGSFAGPWGAALGGAVGAAMDLAAANDDLEASFKKLADTPLSDLAGRQAALASASGKLDDYASAVRRARDGEQDFFALSDQWSSLTDRFTNESAERSAALQEEQELTRAFEHGLRDLLATASGGDLSYLHKDLDQLGGSIETVMAALEGAGLDPFKVLVEGENRGRAVAAVRDYVSALDSVPGRSKAVADAFADLDDQMLSSIDSADALSAALNALLSPELDQADAADAWQQSLNDLNDSLAQNSKRLGGNSDAALMNRGAIRDRVRALQATIEADAKAGVGAEKLAEKLRTQRRALLNQADAAGLSREATADLLKQYGLTPKLVQTIFKALGISRAEQEARALRDRYNALPKAVRTQLEALGGNATRADVEALQRKYNLTPKQVRTILAAIDQASGIIARVSSSLASIDGRVAETIIRTRYETVMDRFRQEADGGVLSFADGGYLPPIGAQQPQIQANHGPRGIQWAETGAGPWEAFISGHPAKKDRSRDVAEETVGRLGGSIEWRMASGGMLSFADGDVLRPGEFFRASRGFNPEGELGLSGVRSELRDFRKAINEAGGDLRGNFDRLSNRLEDVTRRYGRVSRALEREREQRANLRRDAASYRSSVQSTFSGDIFGNGLAGGLLQLRADRNDARDMLSAGRRADRLGLSGAAEKALLASGDLQFAQQLNTRAEVRTFERLYAQRARAQSALGGFAREEGFGRQIDRQNRIIGRQNKTLNRLDKRLEGLEDAVQRGARKGVGDRNRSTRARARRR